MSVATLIAYQYDIFPKALGAPTQARVIELDEVVALAGLFCAGLFALTLAALAAGSGAADQRRTPGA